MGQETCQPAEQVQAKQSKAKQRDNRQRGECECILWVPIRGNNNTESTASSALKASRLQRCNLWLRRTPSAPVGSAMAISRNYSMRLMRALEMY